MHIYNTERTRAILLLDDDQFYRPGDIADLSCKPGEIDLEYLRRKIYNFLRYHTIAPDATRGKTVWYLGMTCKNCLSARDLVKVLEVYPELKGLAMVVRKRLGHPNRKPQSLKRRMLIKLKPVAMLFFYYLERCLKKKRSKLE